MQSGLLTAVAGVALALVCMEAVQFALRTHHGRLLAQAGGLSLIFSLAAWRLRAATLAGALAGGMICLLITFYTASTRLDWLHTGLLHSGLLPLLELFILTVAATHAGRRRKTLAGLAESRRGRTAAQILANLGVAGLASSNAGAALIGWTGEFTGHFIFIPYAIPVLLLAALCEATADTVASETGQAFGGRPLLLTTLRRVDPGTDGAVSLLGTAAGLIAAALVAAVGAWAMRMNGAGGWIALGSGIAGLWFDTLLGATLERRGWLGNDWVNAGSTLFAALLALAWLAALSPSAS